MKKLSLKVAVVIAFVTVAGYGVYSSQKSNKTMSELTLENLEALADNEYDTPYRLHPCPGYGEGNECKTSSEDRPKCAYLSYCN